MLGIAPTRTTNMDPVKTDPAVRSRPAKSATPSSSAVSSSHSLPSSINSSAWQAASEDSVRLWMSELRWYVESDCSNVLHNKAIPQQQQLQHQSILRHQNCLPASPRVSIEMLELNSRKLLADFNAVLVSIQSSQLKRVHPLLSALTSCLRGFLQNLHRLLSMQQPVSLPILKPQAEVASFREIEETLLTLCSNLDTANSELLDVYLYAMSLPAVDARFLVMNGHLPPVDAVLRLLAEAAEAFAAVLDAAELQLLERVVNAVRCKTSGANFTAALRDLLRLAMKSERLSCLVAKAEAVETVLQVCSDRTQRKFWPLALRVLSCVCCVEESIRRFDQSNGLATVSGILGELGNSELVRAEAAGVVAQLTSPYILGKGKDLLGCLTSHAESLVKSLTLLCKEADCHDVFLLASAAIANITFISPASFEYMLKYNTVRALVDACQLSKAASLFAKDQVATVLANMAAYAWCHQSLTRHNAIELLLHFLSESPMGSCRYASSSSSGVKSSACERLQQKAAIALGRLARDASAAQIVVELAGANRLAQLCRRPEERNNSDAVLVAALAALRQIHDSVGSEDLEERDVVQLIRPRLSEAFLACSRLDESYV
ncbi:hypothetical protein BOX15_Mlig024782g2 [Macrostomum lignano]|uniref:Protein inscuteable homologue C-terminal domain-containing protein n=1 Tax=Macrostomum lignano TaxID=282301 RepID=A0A267EVV4_9PLAT|nr:hypothetical protein BOX15_Mlig024782g2 [Macrostomum lignano]